MAGTKPSRAPLSRRSERLKRRQESTLSHESQPDGDDNEKNTEEGTPEPPPVPRRKRRKKDDSDSDPDDADTSSPEPAKRHGKSDSQQLQAIDNFVSRADRKFGPATTLCKNGRIVKHIPWKAFEFSDQDWQRVDDVREILEVCCFPPCQFVLILP